MTNPELYVNHLWIDQHCNDYSVPSLNLSECGCQDVSHDRLFSNVRKSIEGMVIEACKAADANHNQVKLLSVGPGGGLQDFNLILKLFSMGVKHIELTLIEPEYSSLLAPVSESTRRLYCNGLPEDSLLPESYYRGHQANLYSIIRAISLLTRCFSEAQINIFQYHSADDFKKDTAMTAPFDVIYGIDFEAYEDEKAKADFDAAAQFLKPGGKAFVSCHHQITTLEMDEKKSLLLVDSIKFEPISRLERGYVQQNELGSFFKS